MTKHIYVLIFFLASISYAQQKNQGVVYYLGEHNLTEMVNNYEKKIKKDDHIKELGAEVLQLLKKHTKEETFILSFDNNVSSFVRKNSLDRKENAFNITKMAASKNVYTENKKVYNQKDAFGDTYIISSSWDDVIWTIDQDSTKEIRGYSCYRATTKDIYDNNKSVTAWFCPSLPFNYGPLGYGNLPGLILELTIGDFKYTLKELNLKDSELKKETLKKPKKGKLVTASEFREIGVKAMEVLKNN